MENLDYKMPIREQNSNKGTFGRILNIAGSDNYIGAAYLSTYAALKIGAGYVALATEPNVIKSVSQMLPEAVYMEVPYAYRRLNDFTVVLIGCGISQGFTAKHNFKFIINYFKNKETPIVIDADGLNILAAMQNICLPQNTIITPHPMEAARLLVKDINDVLADLESSAMELVEKYNCTVVLKTHRTIICDKCNMFVNEYGNSALAKAGTGDVLAGIISGLLAQKMIPFEAAKLGVYLHSRAGELASEELTEYSVMASDVLKYLPLAIKELMHKPIK